MTYYQFMNLCIAMEVYDLGLNPVSLDRIFMTTTVAPGADSSKTSRVLYRHTFIEALCRIALVIYVDIPALKIKLPKEYRFNKLPKVGEAFKLFLNKNVLTKFTDLCKPDKFRTDEVFKPRVDELLRKNELVVRQLYDTFNMEGQPFLLKKQLYEIMTASHLNLGTSRLNECLLKSQVTLLDTVNSEVVSQSITYPEFLMFLCRVAQAIYSGTKQESEPLESKLETILEPVVSVIGLSLLFRFPKS